MQNLFLITATLSMLLFGCVCDEKKEADVEAVTDASDASTPDAATPSDAEASDAASTPDAVTPSDAVVLPGDVTPQG